MCKLIDLFKMRGASDEKYNQIHHDNTEIPVLPATRDNFYTFSSLRRYI